MTFVKPGDLVPCRVCGHRVVIEADETPAQTLVRHAETCGGDREKEDSMAKYDKPQAEEVCPVCGKGFFGDSAREARSAMEHHALDEHGSKRIMRPTMGKPSRKAFRWTITGEGAPMANRENTWESVSGLVKRAEKMGLRVEVAEVEQEYR